MFSPRSMVGSATLTIDTSRNVMNPATHRKARIRPGWRGPAVTSGAVRPRLTRASGTDITHSPMWFRRLVQRLRPRYQRGYSRYLQESGYPRRQHGGPPDCEDDGRTPGERVPDRPGGRSRVQPLDHADPVGTQRVRPPALRRAGAADHHDHAEGAHPATAPTGARRARPAYVLPGGTAPGRVRDQRPRPQPRATVRHAGRVVDRQPGPHRAGAHAVRRPTAAPRRPTLSQGRAPGSGTPGQFPADRVCTTR